MIDKIHKCNFNWYPVSLTHYKNVTVYISAQTDTGNCTNHSCQCCSGHTSYKQYTAEMRLARKRINIFTGLNVTFPHSLCRSHSKRNGVGYRADLCSMSTLQMFRHVNAQVHLSTVGGIQNHSWYPRLIRPRTTKPKFVCASKPF